MAEYLDLNDFFLMEQNELEEGEILSDDEAEPVLDVIRPEQDPGDQQGQKAPMEVRFC